MTLLKQSLAAKSKANLDFRDCFFAICDALIEFQQQRPAFFETVMDKISVDPIGFDKMPVLKEIYNVGKEVDQIAVALFKKGIEQSYVSSKIKIQPMVFILWSSLVGVIRIAKSKEEYILQDMGMTYQAFLRYSFEYFFKSLIMEG